LTTAPDVVVEPEEAEADAVVEIYWLAILDTERTPLVPHVPDVKSILRMHLRGATGFSKETKLLSLQRPAKSGPGRAMYPASKGFSVVLLPFEKAAILSPLSKALSSVACVCEDVMSGKCEIEMFFFCKVSTTKNRYAPP
jgi:hypothetical protein